MTRGATTIARDARRTGGRALLAASLVAGLLAWTAGPAAAATAPSLRSLTVAGTGSVEASSLPVAVPAGVQTGDVLVLFFETSQIGIVGGLGAWTPLDGDTAGDSLTAASYYRVASAEPASYTLTFPQPVFASAAMLAYTGVDTSNPISAHGSLSQGSWVTSMTAPLLGAVGPFDLVLVAFQPRGVTNGPFTMTPPGNGWTQRAQDTTTDPLSPAVGASVVDKVAGTDTPTETSSVQVTHVTTAVALRAAGSSPPPVPGAPALRSVSTANTGSPHRSGLTVQVPPGTTNGDLLVLFLDDTESVAPGGLAGWTLLDDARAGSSLGGLSYYRVASSEPASYSMTFPIASHATATMLAYTGVATTNPIGAHGAVGQGSYSTTLTAPLLTGVGPTDLVLVAFHSRGVPDGSYAMTPPGNGWTEWAQQSSTSGNNPDAGSSVVAKVGATDSPRETTGVQVTYVTTAMALRPAQAPPADAAPAAALTVTPASGSVPLPVTADASASTDTDATPIATYTFDFGDGTVVGPQAGATAPHTYQAAGAYTARVTVTDTGGLSSTATSPVSVGQAASGNLVGNPGFETSTTGWRPWKDGHIKLSRVSGGHSGDWSALLKNTDKANHECTLDDSPSWIQHTSAGTYTGSMWVRADKAGATLYLRFREYDASRQQVGYAAVPIVLSTAWQQVTVMLVPAAPGSSWLDFNAYVVNAPNGNCFYADDASIALS
ncbi:MAG: PKD domain-containing protein [Actinomycetota bacterium]|nr:PKD domain-containing protein [Actinomycetota bacterium]